MTPGEAPRLPRPVPLPRRRRLQGGPAPVGRRAVAASSWPCSGSCPRTSAPRRADEPPRHRRPRGDRGVPAPRRPATILVVTHDRRFLETICDRLWVVDAGLVAAFDGGYRAWRAAVADGWTVAAAARAGAAPAPPRGSPDDRSRGRAEAPGPLRAAAPRARPASPRAPRRDARGLRRPAVSRQPKLSKDAYRRQREARRRRAHPPRAAQEPPRAVDGRPGGPRPTSSSSAGSRASWPTSSRPCSSPRTPGWRSRSGRREVAAMTVRIGLTGPIGCGKSTVAGWLGELGATVIDADADRPRRSSRPASRPSTPCWRASAPRSGTRTASLDRAALGRLVFADPAALRRSRGDRPPGRPAADPRRARRGRDAPARRPSCRGDQARRGRPRGPLRRGLARRPATPPRSGPGCRRRGAEPADAERADPAQGDLAARLRPRGDAGSSTTSGSPARHGPQVAAAYAVGRSRRAAGERRPTGRRARRAAARPARRAGRPGGAPGQRREESRARATGDARPAAPTSGRRRRGGLRGGWRARLERRECRRDAAAGRVGLGDREAVPRDDPVRRLAEVRRVDEPDVLLGTQGQR